MSAEGLERLHRAMDEAGLRHGLREGEPPTVNSHTVTLPELEPDTRLANERCCICIGPMSSLRKVRVRWHQWAHAICAGQPQIDEQVLRIWLALPIEVRRRRVIQHYGLDPMSITRMPTQIEVVSVTEDVDGVPVRIEVERSTLPRLRTMGVPRCYWAVAEEEGWIRWHR